LDLGPAPFLQPVIATPSRDLNGLSALGGDLAILNENDLEILLLTIKSTPF
jgi:hypothetical protein